MAKLAAFGRVFYLPIYVLNCDGEVWHIYALSFWL